MAENILYLLREDKSFTELEARALELRQDPQPPAARRLLALEERQSQLASREKELQEAIEVRGGKATGSVTSKTTYLINNDVASNSSKNKKAKDLGVPIISEEEFIKMLGE